MSSSQYFHYMIPTLIIFPVLANARTCSEGFYVEAAKRNITRNCALKTLGAEFAWNFDNRSKQLDIAFGAPLQAEAGWLAWGLNPLGPRMVGTRTLVGVKLHGQVLEQHMYTITAATKRYCQPSPSDDIDLDVRNFSFVHLREIEYYVIFATVVLSEEYNSSRTNVVWQIGLAGRSGGGPRGHPTALDNLDSAETVNLISGAVVSFSPVELRQLRMAHGGLNIVGWGILIPTGVLGARYFRVYPIKGSWWFVFHVSCQIFGYILGSTGWIIGLWLGHRSYYSFPTHRIIGIFIFTFTTIQMMALRLKPKGSDEYRSYWNMYHHILGYALLAMISVNIFEGIKILDTKDHSWRWAYIAVLGVLGAIAMTLEIYTWFKFSGFWNKLVSIVAKSGSTNQSSSQVRAAQAPVEPDVQPQPHS